MKTLGRILIITVVFALVMGITYVAVNATSSGSFAAGPGFDDDGRFQPNGERPNFGDGDRPESPGGERGERLEWGGSALRMFAGAIKNTAIIAILVALIVVPKGWLQRRKRQTQIDGV